MHTERGQLRLRYRPQSDLATNRVIGAEALLRWTHPMPGPIAPGHFIPVAKDSGLPAVPRLAAGLLMPPEAFLDALTASCK